MIRIGLCMLRFSPDSRRGVDSLFREPLMLLKTYCNTKSGLILYQVSIFIQKTLPPLFRNSSVSSSMMLKPASLSI
jgi:hypothetical protein